MQRSRDTGQRAKHWASEEWQGNCKTLRPLTFAWEVRLPSPYAHKPHPCSQRRKRFTRQPSDQRLIAFADIRPNVWISSRQGPKYLDKAATARGTKTATARVQTHCVPAWQYSTEPPFTRPMLTHLPQQARMDACMQEVVIKSIGRRCTLPGTSGLCHDRTNPR